MGGLLPVANTFQIGILNYGQVGSVEGTTKKNIKLFYGDNSIQIAVLIKFYNSGANRVFIIECNNGNFVITSLSKGSYGYSFYVKDSCLYATRRGSTSFSCSFVSLGQITYRALVMEANDDDLADATSITVQ